MLLAHLALDDGPDGVDDVRGRKVVSAGEQRPPRLLRAPAPGVHVGGDSARSPGPATAWMTLSMQACPGTRQPSMAELAALTMAPARSAVRSPRHRATRSPSAPPAPRSRVCYALLP